MVVMETYQSWTRSLDNLHSFIYIQAIKFNRMEISIIIFLRLIPQKRTILNKVCFMIEF